jgi:putative PIN family toxin of toxin-antitoxin system
MTASAAPRTVLDTNTFVSGAIVSYGPSAQVLDAWLSGEFLLLTSADLIAEVTNVLNRPTLLSRLRLGPRRIEELIDGLEHVAERVVPLALADLPIRCRDPKDDKFLACAIAGRADFIVTGDDDLLELAGDEHLGKLRIVRVREFLERLA